MRHQLILQGGYSSTGDKTAYAFDGVNGTLLTIPSHSDWNWGNGDFTWELWFNTSTSSNYISLINDDSDAGDYWQVDTGASGALRVYATGGIALNFAGDGTDYRDGAWHHVAVVRETTTIYLYIDGVQQTSTGSAGTSSFTGGDGVRIGAYNLTGGTLLGYLDEIRLSDTARYTGSFTPSTTEFESDANTVLLIHGGESKSGTTGSGATFTDSGNTGHTVSENGGAIEDTSTYKF